MRKILSCSLILGFLLAGCNFPLYKTAVSPAAVATQVAFFLTQTAQSPSPSETPSSNQATPSAQPSPSITPTPSDPVSSLGTPYWSNGLNSGVAFGLNDPYVVANTKISLQNGKMILTSLTATGWKEWRLTDRNLSDYYLEALFTPQGCSGLDQYGLVFRAPDYSSGMGYYYVVSCDGRFGLMKWSSSNPTYTLNWTANPEIKAGPNQTNRLGVYLKGNSIRLFMNGKQIFETSDSTFQSATKLGAYMAALSTPGFTVEMSQIQLWAVP